VVDNASQDGSPSAIAEKFPMVKLVNSKSNIGFAKANNLAAEQATGAHLLLLNPDTVVLDRAIDRLFSFAMTNDNEGIYGGVTLDGNGELDPTSCWKSPSLWSVFCYGIGLTSVFKRNLFFDPESYGHWKRDTVRDVDIVTGCFLMVSKANWVKLNGFSEDFFMYAEEADLCLRAIKIGIQPIIYPHAIIIHYGGASERIPIEKRVRMLKSKVILIRKHWNSRITVWLAIKLLLFGALIRSWNPIKYFTPTERNLLWREVWKRRSQWAGQ
jgi:GT2 family glycosyltransferase